MLVNNTVYFLNIIWTYCTCMYYVSEINEYYYYYKAREDIRKHNLDEIRETIEVSKSLKKVRRSHNLGKTG